MSTNTKETTKEIVKKEDRFLEYVPFGAQDKIRLSINIIRRLVAVPTSTGKLPSDEDCIKFQMMCQAKRLNPFEGDAFMIGYDTKYGPKFSQITAHQVFLKRAEASPVYDGMESGVLVKLEDGTTRMEEGDYIEDGWELVGAWCRVHKKEQKFPIFKKIKLATFDKGTSQWVANKAGMIVKCAEADALRTSFPSLLGSLYIKEELQESVDMTAITKPMFNNPTKEVTAPIEADVVDPKIESLEKLKALIERDGVNEADLINLLQFSGLAGEGCKTIGDLANDDLVTTISSWDTLMANMKGGAK